MTKEAVKQILSVLDKEYGTTKEGFLYEADWQLLLAIMLSAQSTDKQVDEVLPGLWKRFSNVRQIAEASEEEIQDQIRMVGLYKNKAKNMKQCCRQLMDEYGGKVPAAIDELLKLAGVGRKTATLFLADAYNIPGVTVDTHVFRIARRLGWAEGKNPVQVEFELMELLPEEHWNRINFQLIYHGRSICTARKCHCERCFLSTWCDKKM
ncbi:endonuclease-3 [Anaerotaenia torta]|uniref:endonuclease III n=1 Tax=Anaerotaenia torta TaxID=433293 RepID=UPI003D239A2D